MDSPFRIRPYPQTVYRPPFHRRPCARNNPAVRAPTLDRDGRIGSFSRTADADFSRSTDSFHRVVYWSFFRAFDCAFVLLPFRRIRHEILMCNRAAAFKMDCFPNRDVVSVFIVTPGEEYQHSKKRRHGDDAEYGFHGLFSSCHLLKW